MIQDQRLDEARSRRFLDLLQALPVTVDDETAAQAWAGTPHLARAHGLSAYDAASLELAMRRGLPLATLDTKLIAAGQAVGIARFAVI